MRNKIKILVFCFFCGLTVVLHAQSELITGITEDFRNNSVETVLENLDEDVQLTLLEDEDSFEKAKAVLLLRKFFAEVSPSSYELKHQGESSNGAAFVIGELTVKEEIYRIYYVLENELIKEFCVELD